MKINTSVPGQITLELDPQEATILDNLVGQVMALLQTHSSIDLDPDPLLASLEIGGSDTLPTDPALARLFPDAYAESDESSQFRRVTEQGLINRKIEDATVVATTLRIDSPDSVRDGSTEPVSIVITTRSFLPWLRTLTSLRLAMSARLGVEKEGDLEDLMDDEEASSAVIIFQWLGGLTEAILQFEDHVFGASGEVPFR